MAVMRGAAAKSDLLGSLLKNVSRSFYLTLRVLPLGLREPIGLAYLLARAADTIADTSLIPPARRLELLLLVRARINGEAAVQSRLNSSPPNSVPIRPILTNRSC